MDVTFSVRGLPVAQGTARAFVAGGKALIATDSNRLTSPIGAWRAAIATEARAAIGATPAIDGPVSVTAHFVFPRPASHYLPANARRERRELRLDAPGMVTSKPDLDKLCRALLDALTSVVITDDARVAGLMAWKYFEDDDRRPGVEVRVTPLSGGR